MIGSIEENRGCDNLKGINSKVIIMPTTSRSSCGINSFCAGAFLLFVGSVLLCGLGFMVVLPHSDTKNWPEVMCHVTNATYDYQKCMCHKKTSHKDSTCAAKYPCLEINVQYAILEYYKSNKSGLDIAVGHSYIIRKDEDQPQRPDPGILLLRKTTENGYEILREKNRTESLSFHYQTGARLDSDPGSSSFEEDSGYSGTEDTAGYKKRTEQRGHVDPRSTLPYSGPEETSEPLPAQNSATRNLTYADTAWISTTLYRGWNDAFYGKCSLHECGMEEWNVEETSKFKDNWGQIGQTFTCYVNPESMGVVILEKTSSTAVLHAILWPTICLLFGCMLWLGLCFGCCKIEKDLPSSNYSNPKL